ncbi:hypothetical protein ACHHYP_15211 [Achlya hypogyna]|uniref:Uncharacterized protein n=1 Tax=Achlya hypogyna TaxID=1202772 RepID=A0A1V9YBF2_ACHHY|nr:hypothetical protein ACHHYP_15211 [Achlya hypogyna]
MPLTHSMSSRGLLGLGSKRSPKKVDLSSVSGELVAREASSATGFLLGILETAAKSKDPAPAKVPDNRLWRGAPVKITRGLSRTASPANLAIPAYEPDGDMGTDVPAIVELLSKQRYSLEAQLTGIAQLLRRLRHDDAATYQSFAAHGGLALLLLAMREFRFHVGLQTEIARVLSLFCKFSNEYVEMLLKECPLPLIAKTMAVHPKEEHFQLHMSVVQASLRHHCQQQDHQIAYFNDHRPVAPDAVLTTLPRNPPATVSPEQRPPLWLPPDTVCSKHHESFDLESPLASTTSVLYTPTLSSKSIHLAEKSRTPTTSNSPLRRVLSTPKKPHLSADFEFDRPESPLETVRPLRAATVPLAMPRPVDMPELPRSAVAFKRPVPEPHIKPTPTLSAYKAAPLFVEPIALAARIGVPAEVPTKAQKKVRSVSTAPLPAPSYAANANVAPAAPPTSPSVVKHQPASLLEHHAAMTLQRYFRRNLFTPAQVLASTSTPARQVENSAELNAALVAREVDTAKLQEIQVHYCKGLAHQEAGEWELAEESYSLALEIAASIEFVSIHVNLGGAYLSQGRFADAQRMFAKALSIRPKSIAALYNHGLADWHLGDPHAAAAKFASVLTLAPSHAKALYALHVLKTKFHQAVSVAEAKIP